MIGADAMIEHLQSAIDFVAAGVFSRHKRLQLTTISCTPRLQQSCGPMGRPESFGSRLRLVLLASPKYNIAVV
jgi:hypothetical protein